MTRRLARVALVALVALLAASHAAADPAPDDAPWAKGVTAEHKQRALALLGEGNTMFVANRYAEALAKYREAIAEWDHPAIRFNIVRTLVALERPLDAYENLDKALAYGKAPLEDQVFAEAQNYKTLLEGQLATLDVSCAQNGVAVSVDGEPFLACPGHKAARVLPGPHAVDGKKDGFLTETRDVVLLPGKPQQIAISLRTYEQATIVRTRWATWKPWAIAAGGAALGGLGGLLDWKATSDLDAFQHDLAVRCSHTGCTPAQLGSQESTALAENRVAIGMMITGGAAVVTGLVLVFVNRPQAYTPTDTVAPTVTRGGAGVTWTRRF
jgi:tetratricopeptide (TPR) repeat protein